MLVIIQRSKYYPIDGSSGQQLSPINEKVYITHAYIHVCTAHVMLH